MDVIKCRREIIDYIGRGGPLSYTEHRLIKLKVRVKLKKVTYLMEEPSRYLRYKPISAIIINGWSYGGKRVVILIEKKSVYFERLKQKLKGRKELKYESITTHGKIVEKVWTYNKASVRGLWFLKQDADDTIAYFSNSASEKRKYEDVYLLKNPMILDDKLPVCPEPPEEIKWKKAIISVSRKARTVTEIGKLLNLKWDFASMMMDSLEQRNLVKIVGTKNGEKLYRKVRYDVR